MFRKIKAGLTALAFAVALSAAGAVAPVEAKAPARPMMTTTYCSYSWLSTYWWTVSFGGNVSCPSTNTYYIGGSFKTGTLWKRSVR